MTANEKRIVEMMFLMTIFADPQVFKDKTEEHFESS